MASSIQQFELVIREVVWEEIKPISAWWKSNFLYPLPCFTFFPSHLLLSFSYRGYVWLILILNLANLENPLPNYHHSEESINLHSLTQKQFTSESFLPRRSEGSGSVKSIPKDDFGFGDSAFTAPSSSGFEPPTFKQWDNSPSGNSSQRPALAEQGRGVSLKDSFPTSVASKSEGMFIHKSWILSDVLSEVGSLDFCDNS